MGKRKPLRLRLKICHERRNRIVFNGWNSRPVALTTFSGSHLCSDNPRHPSLSFHALNLYCNHSGVELVTDAQKINPQLTFYTCLLVGSESFAVRTTRESSRPLVLSLFSLHCGHKVWGHSRGASSLLPQFLCFFS